jgi:3-oxoacyl-[acyl-carrier-protein] synthase-3
MINFNYKGIRIAAIRTALPANKIQTANKSNAAFAIENQTTSDLGFLAAQAILQNSNINHDEIGALVFLSKTPDYRGPATAMVLQNRLQIPQNCIVYDAPTGNGGFENALNIGAALLDSVQQNFVLVVLGDTVSKQLGIQDFIALNFQDGATAILLEKSQASSELKIAISTNSKFWSSFIVPSGAFRESSQFFSALDSKRVDQKIEHLHINEAHLTEATQGEFLPLIQKIKNFSSLHKTIDTLIFVNLLHSAIEQIFKFELILAGIEKDNIFIHSELCSQTMAATTPIMLSNVVGKFEKQYHIISVSIGEGLSTNMASFLTHDALVQETMYSDLYYDNGFVTHEM